MLLDDVQELFDADNEDRVAGCVAKLTQAGARPLVTTHRDSFRRRSQVVAKNNAIESRVLKIHPTGNRRTCVECGEFVEAVDDKRRRVENDNADADAARDLVNALRIYLEQHLADFFEVQESKLPAKPSLADYVGELQRLGNNGVEPFSLRPISSLYQDTAFDHGSDFLTLMNNSHHGSAQHITPGEVADALPECRRVLDRLSLAIVQFEQWKRRDQIDNFPTCPDMPVATDWSLVAKVVESPVATVKSEARAVGSREETFDTKKLGDTALYRVGCDNLSPGVPRDSVAVVSLSEQQVASGSPVVALYEDLVLLRRVLIDRRQRGWVCLAADGAAGGRMPPPLFARNSEVRMLPLIGVMFGDPPALRVRGEASFLQDASGLPNASMVFRLTKRSGEAGSSTTDLVMAEMEVEPPELASHVGAVVAVVVDVETMLARVAGVVQSVSPLCQLQEIAPLGKTILVRMSGQDSKSDGTLPEIQKAFLVSGVLHDIVI
jgi:hypothetical protein